MDEFSGNKRVATILSVVVLIAVTSCAGPSVAPVSKTTEPSTRESVKSEAAPVPSESPEAVSAGGKGTGRTHYAWDPNTGKLTPLFWLPAHATDAEVSPNGKVTVYEKQVVREHWKPDAHPQIYLLRPNGSERRLTDQPAGAYDPTWSPDGRQIAFASSPREGERTDIFVMDADGSHVRRLVGTAMNDSHPDWSADGTRIAFGGSYNNMRSRIWVASVRTHAVTPLTPRSAPADPPPWDPTGRWTPGMDLAWSPDDRWIAYSRYPTSGGMIFRSELRVMRSDGTDRYRIGLPVPWYRTSESPSWSPDGRLIAFKLHDWSRRSNWVVVTDPKTGHTHQIRADTAGPSWNEDGILVTLPGQDPEPTPIPAPPEFHVRAPGVDATITLTKSSCELRIPAPVRPGRLKLFFVDSSHREASFTVVKLSPNQTMSLLRAHPQMLLGQGRNKYLAPSTSRVWSSAGQSIKGRWAVLCFEDKEPAPNGFSPGRLDVVGPIKVG